MSQYDQENQENNIEFQNNLIITIIISTAVIIMWEILASTQSPIAFSLLAKIFNFGKYVRLTVCLCVCVCVSVRNVFDTGHSFFIYLHQTWPKYVSLSRDHAYSFSMSKVK